MMRGGVFGRKSMELVYSLTSGAKVNRRNLPEPNRGIVDT